MAKNRAAFIKTILEGIEKIIPNSPNVQMYKDMFGKMKDSDIDQYVEDLKNERKRLSIIVPNNQKYSLSTERNLKIAKEWGHSFYQRIWMDPGNGLPKYLTPKKYLVIKLPIKRQAQHLTKKISIPEDNKTIDDYSGQPTGTSKGSRMSYPEIQIMTALNLDNCLLEFLKFRGGDIKGFDAYNASISRTGGVSLDSIKRLGTQVKSSVTLSTLLTGMHLENEGLKK